MSSEGQTGPDHDDLEHHGEAIGYFTQCSGSHLRNLSRG